MMKVLSILIVCLIGLSSNAQKEDTQFKQFNNFTAQFEVPKGKTWIIHQIFSSFAAGVITETNGEVNMTPVRIFIKTLNGDIKTDWEGNRFGPQVFQSDNTSAVISYPITLPEKTKFSLIIVKGNPGSFNKFDGSGYISYKEVTNQ
jgi:hypothetical protein